jgi:hypothetical protein
VALVGADHYIAWRGRQRSRRRQVTTLARRFTAALTCSSLVVLIGAATALAAPKLELTRGSAEPVESIATQLGAVITDGGGSFFALHVKPAGGAGCAANPSADSGEELFGNFISSATDPVTETKNWTFEHAGSFLVCAWVTKNPNGLEVEAFMEATFVVRPPHLSLSINVPATVLPSQAFQIVTTATAETTRQVWEYVIPNTGVGCPANAGAADAAAGENEILGFWDVTGGPFSQSKNHDLETAGSYLVCAYFEYPGRESPPELAASAQMTAVPPPPPCVVPAFHRGAKLASVEQGIRSASCSVGKVHYTASTSVGRGGVISLGAASGTKAANGAPVNIVVSAGRPCVIPSLRRGSSVDRAKRLLAAGNCVAVIAHTHSRRVKRGKVVRLGAQAHSHLYPLSKVPIIVSTGT